jgi:hypothetical protein
MRNLRARPETRKEDFMLKHGYIKNDFDVQKWAAPEFLEQAAKELLEEQWKKKTMAKLPKAAAPLTEQRLGNWQILMPR